jgi:hypothetical protein
MPEIHLPQLDDEEEEIAMPSTGPVLSGAKPRSRAKSVLKIVLEVALISMGVFLGLLGEQWRQSAEHRETARTSLEQFRAEIADNRQAVAAVAAYHADLHKNLDAFLASDQPQNPAGLNKSNVRISGLRPVNFSQTAWDLAIATQSLGYMEPGTALAISRAYNLQRRLAGVQDAIVPALYSHSPANDFAAYFQGMDIWLADVSAEEPELLKAYDDALRRIDQRLAE